MAELLSDLVPLLGLTLLHFIWQGASIGLVAAATLESLRSARPQARYAVACLALLACALAPVVTLLALLAPELLAGDFGGAYGTFSWDAIAPAEGALSPFAPSMQIQDWLPAIVAAWAAGTCVLSLRMGLGLAWISRMRQLPQGPAQLAWQSRLDAIAVHFELRRRVALRIVDDVQSPVSAGWLRPVVLVPAALLTRMPTALIEALLAHELAHIRRHDYLVNLVQNLIEAVLFYHPVVWWLSHRIRVERERIADQLAAELACAPRDLARALSGLSDLQHTAPGPALHILQAADGNHLMSRIQHLLRPTRPAQPGARIVFPLLGLMAAGLATYALAQDRDDDEPGIKVRGTLHLDDEHRNGLALVRGEGDEMHMWGSVEDIDDIRSARKRMTGDFLWFRRDGRAYLVTDPALLARAVEATRETDEPERKMDELEAQMEPHSRRLEELEEQMDKLGDMELSPRGEAAASRMDELGQQQEELGNEQDELAERMEDAAGDADEIARLAQQMDELSKRQDALGRQMDEQAKVLDEETRRLEASHAPMEALSREMQLASEPMDAISKQMEVQAELLEKASARVEGKLKQLIDEAVERKLAKPVGSIGSAP